MTETTEKPVVVITGAGGHIGRRLGKVLSDAYRVVGLELSVDGTEPFPTIEADLTDDASMTLAMQTLRADFGERVASVIHLAAYFDFTGQDSPAYQAVNVEGSRRLLEHLADFDVAQLVYSGTMLVHRPGIPGQSIDEGTPLDPGWAYPQSKARAEAAMREAAGDDIKLTFLHLAGLYDETTAVPTLSHQIARIYERGLKSRFYSGNPDAGQAFIHIDDMTAAMQRAVDRRDALDRETTILVGEPNALSYNALQDRLGQLIHGEDRWATITLPGFMAKAAAWMETRSEPVVPDALDEGEKPFIRPFMIDLSSDHYALDIAKAQDVLGWRPEHRIEDELEDLVAALMEDPVRWYRDNGITPPAWMRAADLRGADPEDVRRTHEAEFRERHRSGLWAHWANMGLGAWLMTSPPLLGISSGWLTASNIVTGLVLLIAAFASLSWRMSVARWVAAAAGVWAMMAPLLFWTDNGAAYLNGTLVGMLVAAFALAIGPAPGVSPAAAVTGPTVPKGWDYSPSDWFQRLPVIILAVVGLLISRYLAAYQLGATGAVWDPFFAGTVPQKNGTEDIITSSVSEAWPVPDAGIGALTYALEIVVGVIGSSRRWRTMPWLVMLFGVMIVPLGAVSIFFIVIQPILIGTYCTLCLVAATAMLLQIPYSIDEMVATYQFLRRRHAEGQPWLLVFFTGDTDEGPDRRIPDDFERTPRQIVNEMLGGGMTFPWTLLASAALGVALMMTPLVIGWQSGMAPVNHVVGALVLTVSVTALAVIARAARFLNILLALVLMFAPFMTSAGWGLTGVTILLSLTLIALSIPRGEAGGNYDTWNKYIV